MSRPLHILLKVSGIVIGIPVLALAGFLLFATLTEYRPPVIAPAEANFSGKTIDPGKRTVTFLTWNIGYAGMGSETDFFYDGGKMVIPPRDIFNKALAGIKKTVAGYDTLDFIFLQELDRRSKRAYNIDILAELAGVLPGAYYAFGKTYDCRYVPVPFTEPMGRVVSGLASFSPFRAVEAEVVSLNTNFTWPTSTFMLKRCILALKYRMGGGKELVVVNLHNSAFDEDGSVRKMELTTLQEYLMGEYKKGNWVVAGGDWNDNPRGFDPSLVFSNDPVYKIKPPIDNSFLPGWEFISDPWLTSNRNADMPYCKGITRTTTIDFFVVSPNVKRKGIKTIPMAFEFSDHNPVVMEVELKEMAKRED